MTTATGQSASGSAGKSRNTLSAGSGGASAKRPTSPSAAAAAARRDGRGAMGLENAPGAFSNASSGAASATKGRSRLLQMTPDEFAHTCNYYYERWGSIQQLVQSGSQNQSAAMSETLQVRRGSLNESSDGTALSPATTLAAGVSAQLPLAKIAKALGELVDIQPSKDDLLANAHLAFVLNAFLFAHGHGFSAEQSAVFLAFSQSMLSLLIAKPTLESMSDSAVIERFSSAYKAQLLQLVRAGRESGTEPIVPHAAGKGAGVHLQSLRVFDRPQVLLITTDFFQNLVQTRRLLQCAFSCEQSEETLSLCVSVTAPFEPVALAQAVTLDAWNEAQAQQRQAEELALAEERRREEERKLAELAELEAQIAAVQPENLVNPFEFLSQAQIAQVIQEAVQARFASFLEEFQGSIASQTTDLLDQISRGLSTELVSVFQGLCAKRPIEEAQ